MRRVTTPRPCVVTRLRDDPSVHASERRRDRHDAPVYERSRPSAGAVVGASRARHARRSRFRCNPYQSALVTFLLFQGPFPTIGGTCAALSLATVAGLGIPSSYQPRMSATTAGLDPTF